MAKSIKKRPTKVDIDTLQQTDGALAPRRTAQDMMINDNPYTVTDLNEYRAQLDKLSDADLHDHSVKVGVTPISHRPRLEDRLEEQFLSRINRRVYQPVHIVLSPEAEARRQRLLRGGY